ncbi:MAG: ATP-binding protein [Halobacteriales archaeon]|nr:ATP-binding protein [Halobacteriales archaeon]
MSLDQPEDAPGVVPDDPRLLTQLTEYTDDALWMFSLDWEELVFVNSAYEDIFGQPVAVLQEDPTAFLDAVHPDDRQTVLDGMETLSGGEPVDLEFRVDPDTDYQTWVWVQGQPVYDRGGEPEYVAGYTRDITDQKEYQRKLEQHRRDLERSNDSLREFAYIASHDLQEPLRMVSSYVDLLETEYGEQLDDEAAEYMDFAVNGARRMKRMINSLLEYSRVHTQADEFTATDTAAVFADTRQDLELLIEDHNATVTVGELPDVHADRDQLGQVFQNLIKNGIEHATDAVDPIIEVTASESDTEYEFAVADNGPGIPTDEQDDIFGIFQQGATASSTENTGIGLAIVERIIHRHGGRIWVESDGDTGTTFRFTIPKAAHQPERERIEP